ncbi:MAG: SDR family oxidoreductase [Thiohalomonas sp.]|nr:SDR family oxidoreductase [Thiohalomonas sp.]
MSKVLITGSNAFIGQFLTQSLSEDGFDCMSTYRCLPEHISLNTKKYFAVGNIDAQTQWKTALTAVDSVVHLAARVHVMQETEAGFLAAFRAVNTEGSMNMARQAVASGVKRFVYLTSIKVNGGQTTNKPFYADDQPNPRDPYGVSKFEAEQQLLALGKETGLEVVIIRPPLVYGPEVKDNFNRLIKLLDKSLPLPLAGINNARSLVNIENLCSLIQTCLTHPEAVGEVFLVSDGQDLSTSELFDYIAQPLDKKSRLFYLPAGLIKFMTFIRGRKAEYERLFGSLQVDIAKNEQLLGWQAVVSVQSGIANTVKKVVG